MGEHSWRARYAGDIALHGPLDGDRSLRGASPIVALAIAGFSLFAGGPAIAGGACLASTTGGSVAGMDELLRFVLEARVVAGESLLAWWEATAEQRGKWETPVERAMAGGACADRIGFAFAGGYGEALRALVPGSSGITALCATEEGGAHPKAIQTRLEATGNGGYVVTGRKKWATVATVASSLLVVVSTGVESGVNRLRVVRIAANAPGVRLTPASAPFVPEIPHAEVELDRVAVSESDVLLGDGYDEYLKPFRTVEDVHVHAALVGYLVGVARRHRFGQATVEQLLMLGIATRAIAQLDAKAAPTHVALAGLLASVPRVVEEVEREWAAAPDDEWIRWQRDRALMKVAGSARAARRERAWSTLGA
jgi:acyl-CoA dehydrogenase